MQYTTHVAANLVGGRVGNQLGRDDFVERLLSLVVILALDQARHISEFDLGQRAQRVVDIKTCFESTAERTRRQTKSALLTSQELAGAVQVVNDLGRGLARDGTAEPGVAHLRVVFGCSRESHSRVVEVGIDFQPVDRDTEGEHPRIENTLRVLAIATHRRPQLSFDQTRFGERLTRLASVFAEKTITVGSLRIVLSCRTEVFATHIGDDHDVWVAGSAGKRDATPESGCGPLSGLNSNTGQLSRQSS